LSGLYRENGNSHVFIGARTGAGLGNMAMPDAYLGLCYMLVQTHPRPSQGVAALHDGHMPDLLLRRASGRRPSAQWPDDYDVTGAGGKIVGRIFKALHAPAGKPWAWTIVSDTTSGYGVTREAVLRAFAKSWHRGT